MDQEFTGFSSITAGSALGTDPFFLYHVSGADADQQNRQMSLNEVTSFVGSHLTTLTTANFAANVVDNDTLLTAQSPSRLVTQYAVYTFVMNSLSGLSWKDAVRAASTTNITLATGLENGDTAGGVTLATGDRFAALGQTTAADRGLYTVNASGAPTRTTDADTGAEMLAATFVVQEGTHAGTQWTCNTPGPITLGSTALTFAQIAIGGTTYTGGDGVDVTGTVIAVDATVLRTSGSYSDPAWITSILGSIVSGNITGLAAGITNPITQSQVTNLVADLAAKLGTGGVYARNLPYYLLVSPPPPIYSAEWLPWAQEYTARRLGNVPSVRATEYFFADDGDDGDAGTLAAPFQTVAKLQALLTAVSGTRADIRFRLKGGDVLREATALTIAKSHVTIDSYGTGKAVVTTFLHQYTTGWTNDTGNRWSRSEANAIGWVREGADVTYPFNHIYTRQDSTANVTSTPLSFYYDGTADILYLNPGVGVNPNSLTGGFEACEFNQGGWLVTSDNVRIENLELHGCGMNAPAGGQNYGLHTSGPAGAEHVLVDVDVWYSGYHAIGNASAAANYDTWVRCRAGLCNNHDGNPEGLTVYVSYADAGQQELMMVDCEVGYGALPDYGWTPATALRAGYGVLNHSAGAFDANLIICLRTRYPDHDWQVHFPTQIGAFQYTRIEDCRAFIVGEEPEAANMGVIGDYLPTVVHANCRYRTVLVGNQPGSGFQQAQGWAYNCTWLVDATAASTFGSGVSFWYTAGNTAAPRLHNCYLEMTTSGGEVGHIVTLGTPIGPGFLLQNCTIAFLGESVATPGVAGIVTGMLDHNAYFTESGNPDAFLAIDANGVQRSIAPIDGIVPLPDSPDYGGGVANGLGYDQRYVVRPPGRMDVGPITGVAIPQVGKATRAQLLDFISEPDTDLVPVGNAALWWDGTDGTPRLMITAKQAGGSEISGQIALTNVLQTIAYARFGNPNGTDIDGLAFDVGAFTWAVRAGGWTTQDNYAQVTTTTGGGDLVQEDFSESDLTLTVEIFQRGHAMIQCRATGIDDQNCWQVNLYTSSNQIIIHEVVAGALDPKDVAAFTFVENSRYKVKVVLNGNTITVFIAEPPYTTYEEIASYASASFQNTATIFGLGGYDPFQASFFRNFRIQVPI